MLAEDLYVYVYALLKSKKQFIWMIFIAIIIVYVMLMETNQQYISEIKNTWKAWSMVILR